MANNMELAIKASIAGYQELRYQLRLFGIGSSSYDSQLQHNIATLRYQLMHIRADKRSFDGQFFYKKRSM